MENTRDRRLLLGKFLLCFLFHFWSRKSFPTEFESGWKVLRSTATSTRRLASFDGPITMFSNYSASNYVWAACSLIDWRRNRDMCREYCNKSTSFFSHFTRVVINALIFLSGKIVNGDWRKIANFIPDPVKEKSWLRKQRVLLISARFMHESRATM